MLQRRKQLKVLLIGKQLKNSSGSKTEYGMDPIVTMLLFEAAYYTAFVGILAGAAAIADAVDKHKENKYTQALNKKREEAGLKKDEATGFYKKKSKKTSIEDDASKVNPRFEESKKKGDSKYTTNCMMCTSTYEMRRRGYEVEVQPRDPSIRTPETAVKRWFPDAKVKTFKPSGDDQYYKDYNAMKKQAKKEILSQGEGARGNLMVQWQGAYSGHSVYYEVRNKKIVVIDAQCNRVLPNSDMIFDRASQISVARLDNVDFDPKKIKECCR